MNTERHSEEATASQDGKNYSQRQAVASIAALSAAAATIAINAIQASLPSTGGCGEACSAPDMELCSLGKALEQSWTMEKAHELATQGDGSENTWNRHEAICGITRVIVERIVSLQAQTLPGLIVKARAISWCHGGETIDARRFAGSEEVTNDLKIAASIARDLLRINEAQNV